MEPALVRRFGGVTVRVVEGDIAFRPVDAIVNAANDELAMGGGVAGALRAAGGIELEREASAHAPAPLGAVIRTGAGGLLADHVYHAVVIRHDHRAGTSVETIRVAVREVLALARQDDVARLAVPLLGAGVGGLSVARSLEAILDSLEEHAPGDGSLEVEVVVLDPGEAEDARACLRAHRDRATRAQDEARLAQEYLEQLERGQPG